MPTSKILWLTSLLVSSHLLYAQPPAYPPPPPALQPLTAIEWFVDADPGPGNGTALPFISTPIIGLLSKTASLSVPNGIHRLFIRSKDNNGSWSITASTTFENLHPTYAAAPAPPAPISQLEAFFDKDPGLGNGSLLTVPASTNITDAIFTLNIDTLPKGGHHLFVRPLGLPSMTTIASFNNDVPLPLTWLYVKADDINGQSQISWATAQENNTKNFEIEHSQDGHSFTTVGATPAAGNSNTISYYKWIHTNPDPGINYYRVRQVDLDDKYTWSKIVTLFFASSPGKTTVIPNPVSNKLTILLATPADQSILNIYNTAGQPVLQQKLQDGAQQQDVELGSLPAGVYFLELRYRTHKELLKVIKK